MGNIMNTFIAMIIMQMFFAGSITLYTHSLPEDTLIYVTSFSDISDEISLESTATEVQDSLDSQTNMPLIDVGALVFYSGNIIIDLLLNFAFAIPEMLTLVMQGMMSIFIGIDSFIMVTIQAIFSVIVMLIYFLGIINLVASIRSGRQIGGI